MAKYKAYPEYKDSGVEWLGEVPSHWEILSAKRMFQSVRTPAYKSDEQLAASQKYGVIPQSLMMQLNDSKVMLALKGTESFRHVEANNFVISLRSFEGGIEYSQYTGCVSPAYTVLKNSKPISYSYYRYLLKCSPFIAALQSSTDSLRDGKSINYEQFSALSLPISLVQEQNIIATFLDHETAKIDNLIEKQQQLIELLKEKRQAVISHAVTKGLNPDAPMKDSGVEWLGEVPEHWTISTLKHHAKFIDGDRGSEYPNDNDLVDDGVVFLSSKNISNWEINIDDANYISREKFSRLNRGKTINGDVIVKVRGSTGRIGELAIFETERLNKSTAFINAQMMIIRLKNSFNNRFLCNVAQGHYWMEQLNVGAYGTAQQQLNNAIFSGMIMVVPPIDEQLTINKFLELEIKRFDGLIKNTSNMIQLIQERRTALISAAVTGKIDVRDWVAPDMQDIEEPQEAIA
ncbi:restriction endonuclease subunit S [Citrobacter portucalensis]|uniref:restriction endonuclease subunit S n=1 Tax=Citrobacter portucalensis TaxID=1639133 RepID=UPI002DBD7BC7|nr:restriction endonuclease subunit S [Citrobacter portucalensis]MEB7912970.1 restriction endonuclease subunit S [Citrobacter portucalensis]